MKATQEERAVKALEQRARRAAKRVGLKAEKSRSWLGTANNYGGFRLVDPLRRLVVMGELFNLSPEDVIEFCKSYMQG